MESLTFYIVLYFQIGQNSPNWKVTWDVPPSWRCIALSCSRCKRPPPPSRLPLSNTLASKMSSIFMKIFIRIVIIAQYQYIWPSKLPWNDDYVDHDHDHGLDGGHQPDCCHQHREHYKLLDDFPLPAEWKRRFAPAVIIVLITLTIVIIIIIMTKSPNRMVAIKSWFFAPQWADMSALHLGKKRCCCKSSMIQPTLITFRTSTISFHFWNEQFA